MKHPFNFLRESEYFPHARTLRTSLWQKFKDSFKVLYGDMSKRPRDKDQEPTWGLFDIFTFGIPGLIALANNYVNINRLGIALRTVMFVTNFIFNTAPRFIFSAVFALIAFLPITLPVYLVSKAVDQLGKDSLDVALSLEEVIRGDRINKIYSLKDRLEEVSRNECDLENIRCVKLSDRETSLHYSAPQSVGSEQLVKFGIFGKDPAIKALFAHNIGGIATEYPDLAKKWSQDEEIVVPPYKISWKD